LDRSHPADPFIHLEQLLTQFTEAMKGLDLALRLTQFSGGGEALANRLSFYLASQAEVRAMAWLIGLMAMAVWFSATALDGGDGATAKITQSQDPHQAGFPDQRFSDALAGVSA